VSATRFDVLRATVPVVTAALAVALDERRNPGGVSVHRAEDATGALIREARRLTETVDALGAGDIPKAWRRDDEQVAS
jgi:hypothetical protein